MTLLPDTQGLLWAAGDKARLSPSARRLLNDDGNVLLFSAASPWEVVIQRTLGPDDFKVEPQVLRRGLLDHCYVETAHHGAAHARCEGLPTLHEGPFDRILLAQAIAEGVTLLTHDEELAQYPGPVCLI